MHTKLHAGTHTLLRCPIPTPTTSGHTQLTTHTPACLTCPRIIITTRAALPRDGRFRTSYASRYWPYRRAWRVNSSAAACDASPHV